jgi:hypothetical protein
MGKLLLRSPLPPRPKASSYISLFADVPRVLLGGGDLVLVFTINGAFGVVFAQGEEGPLVLRPRATMDSRTFQEKWAALSVAHTWEGPISVRCSRTLVFALSSLSLSCSL